MDLKQIQKDFANNIIVSRETMVKAIDYAVELEDQVWLLKAELAKKDGYASKTEIDQLLEEFKEDV